MTPSFLILSLTCLLLAATTYAGRGAHPDPSNVELVHVFFRHGKRTPEFKDSYPNDPYTYETFQPFGWGQLTNVGKQQMYQFGKLLRSRYDSFLGDIYTPEVISVSSTDFDRTKITALLVLAGLFPPSSVQQWDNELMWNPIPYHYETGKNDYLIKRPNSYCPTYMKELDEILSSADVQRLIKENRKTFQYIAKHSGRPIVDIMDAFRMYQTLNAEVNMNLTLPDWTKSIYPEPIKSLAGKQCHFENYNEVLIRLNGGHILQKSIHHMQAKIDKDLAPKERKMYLYSGHENNVLNILAALKLYEPHVPNFGSAVIMELHSLPNGKHAVKVFYADQNSAEPKPMNLPECDLLCPYDKFLKITENHIPVNYTAECHSDVFLN